MSWSDLVVLGLSEDLVEDAHLVLVEALHGLGSHPDSLALPAAFARVEEESVTGHSPDSLTRSPSTADTNSGTDCSGGMDRIKRRMCSRIRSTATSGMGRLPRPWLRTASHATRPPGGDRGDAPE